MPDLKHVRITFCIRYRVFLNSKQAVPRPCGSGEMANTLALGASAERLAGSSPAFRTNPLELHVIHQPWSLSYITTASLPGTKTGVSRGVPFSSGSLC